VEHSCVIAVLEWLLCVGSHCYFAMYVLKLASGFFWLLV